MLMLLNQNKIRFSPNSLFSYLNWRETKGSESHVTTKEERTVHNNTYVEAVSRKVPKRSSDHVLWSLTTGLQSSGS